MSLESQSIYNTPQVQSVGEIPHYLYIATTAVVDPDQDADETVRCDSCFHRLYRNAKPYAKEWKEEEIPQ